VARHSILGLKFRWRFRKTTKQQSNLYLKAFSTQESEFSCDKRVCNVAFSFFFWRLKYGDQMNCKNPLNWDSNVNFCKKKYGDPSQFLQDVAKLLRAPKNPSEIWNKKIPSTC
jgi:hypothetical protein